MTPPIKNHVDLISSCKLSADRMTRLIFIAFCIILALFPTVSVSRSIKPHTETRKSVDIHIPKVFDSKVPLLLANLTTHPKIQSYSNFIPVFSECRKPPLTPVLPIIGPIADPFMNTYDKAKSVDIHNQIARYIKLMHIYHRWLETFGIRI